MGYEHSGNAEPRIRASAIAGPACVGSGTGAAASPVAMTARRRKMLLLALFAWMAGPMTDMAQAQDAAAGPAASGACCATLEQVRGHIDRIDAQMIALMAQRAEYVAEAGRFKKDAASVHDGARVERIIVRVRAMAAERKLSPDVAEATYRAMIAAFTEYEKKLVEQRGVSP